MDVIPLSDTFDKSKLTHNQKVLWETSQRMKLLNKQTGSAHTNAEVATGQQHPNDPQNGPKKQNFADDSSEQSQ